MSVAASDPTREQVTKVLTALCDMAKPPLPVVTTSVPPATSDLKTTAEAWAQFERAGATNTEKLRALHRIVLSTRVTPSGSGSVGDTLAAIPAAPTPPVKDAIDGLKDPTKGINGITESSTTPGTSDPAKNANIARLDVLMPSARGGSTVKSTAVRTFLSGLGNQTAVVAAIDNITTGTYDIGMALAGGGRRRKSRKARKARKSRKSRKSRRPRKSRRSRRFKRY